MCSQKKHLNKYAPGFGSRLQFPDLAGRQYKLNLRSKVCKSCDLCARLVFCAFTHACLEMIPKSLQCIYFYTQSSMLKGPSLFVRLPYLSRCLPVHGSEERKIQIKLSTVERTPFRVDTVPLSYGKHLYDYRA